MRCLTIGMAAAPHGDDERPVNPTEREDRAREHSRRLLDAIYRGNLAGLIESTEAGTILDCNDAFARMLGYDSRDELKLLNAGELYYVADERRLVLGNAGRPEADWAVPDSVCAAATVRPAG